MPVIGAVGVGTIQHERAYVYFVGTNTLVQGQPLCYQETEAGTTKGLGMDVEIPNTNNEAFFAGILADEYIGFTGPGFIEIIIPRRGDVLDVLLSDNEDIAVGDVLKLNFDVPTLAASELGAFDPVLATGTVATSLAASVINARIASFARLGRCQAMASLASYTGAGCARTLKKVMFL